MKFNTSGEKLNYTNAASRVLNILREAEKIDPNMKCDEVWTAVFEISESNVSKRHREISRCLGLLNDEIDSIIDGMQLDDMDEFDCLFIFHALEPVLAVTLFGHQWQVIKNKLTREVFVCLGYCREALPNIEMRIADTEVEEIQVLLKELEEQLGGSLLPDNVKKIIQNSISDIYTALHNYKICGADSLRDSINSVVGEASRHKDILDNVENEVGGEEVSRWKKAMRRVSDIADATVDTEKALSAGTKLIERGTKALDMFNAIL
jgi:rubrerythrin